MTREKVKVKLTVKNKRSQWDEVLDIEANSVALADLLAAAQEVVKQFNESLRPYELPRELVSVVYAGESLAHVWCKENTVGLLDKRRQVIYDLYRCARCGITARRTGLGAPRVRRPCQPQAVNRGKA